MKYFLVAALFLIGCGDDITEIEGDCNYSEGRCGSPEDNSEDNDGTDNDGTINNPTEVEDVA